MKCSEREKLLSDYLDEALGQSKQRELEEHLKTCAYCREILKEMKQTDHLARQAMLADDLSPESWAARWPEMRKRILAESEKISRPPSRSFFSQPWWRPALAAAAGIMFLVATCLLCRSTSLRPLPEEAGGKTDKPTSEPARAEDPLKGRDSAGDIIPAGDIRKDLALFCGIQKSFSSCVKWVAIDGEEVDFGLSSEDPEKDAAYHQALLFLDFKITRLDREPEDKTISSPRIIVRNTHETNNTFALPPETGLTYQLRATPRIEAKGKISLDLELVFHQINVDGEEKARFSVAPTLEPGNAVTLGSVLPGDELYQIKVVATVEDHYPSRPGEEI